MIAMFLTIAYLCKPRAIDVYRDKTPTPPTPPTPTTTTPTTHPPTPTTTHPTTTTLEITYFEFN